MKRKSIIQLSFFIGLTLVGLFVSSRILASKEELKSEPGVEQLKKVKVSPVHYEPLQFTMQYSGRVISSRLLTISSEVSGKLEAGDINFKDGQAFRKGDVLVRIEDKQMQASMRALKSHLISAMAQLLPDIQIDLPTAYPKWKSFFAEVTMEQDLPSLPTINSEKERIYIATKNILSQYYEILQQEILLKKHVIRADFDGFIYATQMEVGAIAGPTSPLAQLIRSDVMELEVPIKQSDAHWLKAGKACTVIRNEGDMLDAHISRIAGYVNQSTQMVSVYVQVDAGQDRIYQGEYLEAQFKIQRPEKVFKLNREAMNEHQEIFYVEEGTLKQQKMALVQRANDTLYLQGLQENQLVVNESVINPVVGDTVEIIMATY